MGAFSRAGTSWHVMCSLQAVNSSCMAMYHFYTRCQLISPRSLEDRQLQTFLQHLRLHHLPENAHR